MGNPRSLAVFAGFLHLMGSKAGGLGANVWRSANGTDFVESADLPNDPTDDLRDFPSFAVFDGALYGGTRNDGTTGGELWRTLDGVSWSQVGPDGLGDPDNQRIGLLIVFSGRLFAGTFNPDDGAHLYRSSDGVSWENVVGDDVGTTLHKGGFGSGSNDPNNSSIFAGAVLNGDLYVGIKHQGGTSGPSEVWQSADGLSWTQSGLDGFGDAANEGIDAMATSGGRLFVGTINTLNGAELWSTVDGSSWRNEASGGFGDASDNTRVRSMIARGDDLVLGLGNGQANHQDSRGEIFLFALPGVPGIGAAGAALLASLLAILGGVRLAAIARR
jgi:hypothetical protein